MRCSLTLTPALSLALLSFPLAAQTGTQTGTPAATPAPAKTPAATQAAAAPAVSSASPAKRAKVQELLELTNTDTGSKQILAGFPDRVRTLAARQPIAQAATTPEQKKLTADYLDQMTQIASSGAKWEVARPQIEDLYLAAFSESDLDGIIAFYKSAAGKALVSKTPELSQKTIEILQAPITQLGPQFEAATKAYQTSMQNTSPAGGASKPPTLGPQTPAPTKPTTTAPKK